MAIFVIRWRISPRLVNSWATIRKLDLKKALAAPSSGTAVCSSRQRQPHRGHPHKRLRPGSNNNRFAEPRPEPRASGAQFLALLWLGGFAVAQLFAGFRSVVIPEEQRLEFLLLRPNLIQGVAFEEFAVLHHPMNGVRVVDVLQRAFVE